MENIKRLILEVIMLDRYMLDEQLYSFLHFFLTLKKLA